MRAPIYTRAHTHTYIHAHTHTRTHAHTHTHTVFHDYHQHVIVCVQRDCVQLPVHGTAASDSVGGGRVWPAWVYA